MNVSVAVGYLFAFGLWSAEGFPILLLVIMDNLLPPQDTQAARRYNRIHRRLSIASAALSVLLLVVLLVTGWTRDLHALSFRVAGQDNYSLALFFYIFVLLMISKAVESGLDFYSFRLEHEYHLSNQKLKAWMVDNLKGFFVTLAISALLAEILYFIIQAAPVTWWIIAWMAFLVLFVLMAQLAPIVLFPIFYNFETLKNESLRERLMRLSEKAKTRVRGVYEWKLSEKSNKANAALMGLGNTRRIVISDTLLANYTDDEVEAVMAHELGHHVHRHIIKGILVQAATSFAGFWVLKTVLRKSGAYFVNQADFSNLPLIILVTMAMTLLTLPLMNAYSRYNEREADRYAWKSIASLAPFTSAIDKLASQNLAEREPSKIVEILFHSHPPVAKRIAAAQKWAAAKR
jgi:STE24 endopeptidase